MAYGTTINVSKQLSYVSTVNSGAYPPYSGVVSGAYRRVIRSGANGTYSDGAYTYKYVKVPRFRIGIVGTAERFKTIRQVTRSFQTGGKPIYATRKIRTPSGIRKERYISGYSKIRTRYVYKYTKLSYFVNVYGKIPYMQSKRIKMARVPGRPDQSPHPLLTSSLTISGADAAVIIELRQKAFPYLINTTNLVGLMGGEHAGARNYFGPASGSILSQCASVSARVATEFTRLSAECVNKLYDNVNDHAANLGELAAERNQVMKMVSSIFGSLVDLTLNTKKTLSKLVSSTAEYKTIANNYLAYVYGVAPLIDDISKSFDELNSESRSWRKYKATKRFSFEEVQDYSTEYSRVTIIEKYELICKNQVVVTGTDSCPSFLASHGLTNLKAVAWEVVPWSFVVDWLIPIGNYLQSDTVFSGVSIVSWHESTLMKKRTTMTVLHNERNSSSTWVIDQPPIQVAFGDLVHFRREIKAGAPPYTLPTFKNPFSFKHAANALMLLIQKL